MTVCGPAATDEQFGFRASGARFLPVEVAVSADPLRDAVAVASLRKALRGPSGAVPDVIHAHGLRAGLIARLAKQPGAALAVTWHTHLDTSNGGVKDRVLREAEKAVARGARVCVCTDPDQIGHILASGAQDVRYLPVAAPALAPPVRDAAAVKTELEATARPLILTVGRLHPVKRLDLLIEAAARWRDLDPAPVVAVAGDGPLAAELETLVARSGAPVRLLGRRQDVSDLIHAADLAVVTSDSEARQMFSQEAMRAGLPLIATRSGGTPALVGDGAELIEPGDVDALDKAVRRLLGSPEAADAVARAGEARAADWPSEKDTVDQLDALYMEIAG